MFSWGRIEVSRDRSGMFRGRYRQCSITLARGRASEWVFVNGSTQGLNQYALVTTAYT